VAPERRIPAPVTELRASVEGRLILLDWTNPGHRADGTRMKDLTTVRVYRREEPGQSEPKPAMLSRGKVVGYDEIAAIQMAAPAPARVDGGKVRWADSRGLTLGRRYVYVVTAVDAIGRQSLPWERLVVIFHPAPRPPGDLRATPGDREVLLTWSPPSGLIDGNPLPRPVAYRLLRAITPGTPLLPISPFPLTATEFTDRQLDNERTYSYAVQAVRTDPAGNVWSEPSATVEATPVDLTPPAAPQNLVAVPSEAAVRLAWDPSPEEDVAGYLVYRATSPSEAYTRLTPAAIPGRLFIDRTVERGATYRYVITAVDRAKRPNESARSAPTTVTVP
jgi:hypothetical protein